MTLGGGSLWVALARERKLVRLDPRTGRRIGDPIALPMAAAAVTYLGGAPWVALDIGGDNQRGTIARIDPDSGQITASDTVRDGVVAIKAVRGSVWVLTGTSARLLELDANALRQQEIKLRQGGAGGMAYGAGAFWVSLNDYDAVAKVDPDTANVATVGVGSGPAGVDVLQGRVWVANRTSSTVTQVSTRTLRVVGKPINVAINPVEMAATADDIWITSVGRSAVQRIRVGPAS
jgi:DNA-binding beta-propeller fold protein YncE